MFTKVLSFKCHSFAPPVFSVSNRLIFISLQRLLLKRPEEGFQHIFGSASKLFQLNFKAHLLARQSLSYKWRKAPRWNIFKFLFISLFKKIKNTAPYHLISFRQQSPCCGIIKELDYRNNNMAACVALSQDNKTHIKSKLILSLFSSLYFGIHIKTKLIHNFLL